MTAQITILGLGKIGASIGLALAGRSDQVARVGHDREPGITKQALAKGAVDRIFYNLPASVENADIVMLALPFNQIRDTVQVIAPCLQENAVVMDTSPVKKAVAEWMKELLPPNRHYVGLTPAINPLYLLKVEKGIHAAHPDMFTKGVMAVSSPPGTVGAAIKLAADLSSLLGATPFFVDLEEVDGMMAGLHILPQLTAAAFTNVIMDRPGWKDARKLAGCAYAEASTPVDCDDEDDALIETALRDHTNVIGILDEMIASLDELREEISGQEKENLTNWLEHARKGHSIWWQERNNGDWRSAEFKKIGISRSSLWKRLFGDLGKLFGPPIKNEPEKK